MKPHHSSHLRRLDSRERSEIRRYRVQRGLTQSELAKQLGIRIATLSCWEGGFTCPTLKMAARLASILQTSIPALYPEIFFALHEGKIAARV